MTFEQLETFLAAAEADTFFDAAESVHITQSTLSKQIQKLEKELELTLFDRSRRRAALTPAGEAFYPEAQKLLRQYQEMRSNMRAFSSSSRTSLSIGTLPFLAQYHLTGPIRKFVTLHPQISLTLSEVEEEALLRGLSDDTFSFVIARETMIDRKVYSFHPLAEDTLSVILPENHPLASHASLSLEDIRNENFLLMHPYTSIYQLCRKLFAAASLHPHILRTARIESIISAVQINEGISLFPESNFLLFRHEGLLALPLTDAPKLRIGIAYKKNRNVLPVLKDFLSYFS